MIPVRTFIFGFPLLVGLLAWWSADVSRQSHLQRSKDGIVVMLPQNAPVLNPFLPATEVEREIISLVHEPLLRVGADGALRPALAELWRWTQEVTCWFADEAAAKRAHERLLAQIGDVNRWVEWRLSSAEVRGDTLLLAFNDTGASGVQRALESIADLEPRPASFWRVEAGMPLRAAWDRFAASSPEARQIRSVWFDGANACELVVTGSSQRVIGDLRAAFIAATGGSCALHLLGQAGALVEPVLDLDIRPGRKWHDGTPVTAEDARATLDFLRSNDRLAPDHEALRHIQSVETRSDGARLHITFRRRYGPALGVFADLPVLPAAWLRDHPRPAEADFLRTPPPGAGSHRIGLRETRALVLVPTDGGSGMPRFLFNFDASPLMTQIGMRTRTVDVVWPAAAADNVHFTQLRFTPPRQRLVVLWNTRNSVLGRVEFRSALALATDVEDLIRTVPGRLGRVDGSVFAPGLWFSTRARHAPFDIEQARHILTDAGWPRDVEGVARNATQAFRFTLLVPAGDGLHRRTAERLAAQWRRLGAQVSLEFAEDAQSLQQRLRAHQFDAVLLDQRFEVSWDQLPWWHSSQTGVGGTNFCGITDPQIDLYLEALAGEFDPERVPARVRELEARLLPLHPLLTLFTTHDEAAVSPALRKPSTEDALATPWTLRSLTTSPKPAAITPVIDLKMRETDG